MATPSVAEIKFQVEALQSELCQTQQDVLSSPRSGTQRKALLRKASNIETRLLQENEELVEAAVLQAAATKQEVELLNQELCDTQEQLISSPRSKRKGLLQQADTLEQHIAEKKALLVELRGTGSRGGTPVSTPASSAPGTPNLSRRKANNLCPLTHVYACSDRQ